MKVRTSEQLKGYKSHHCYPFFNSVILVEPFGRRWLFVALHCKKMI